MNTTLFSADSIWTMVHGIVLGGGAMLALAAALFSLRALRSADGAIYRRFDLSDGVTIQDIQPGNPEINQQPRHFVLLPGGAPPAIMIELINRRRQVRRVRVDPITGAPDIQRVSQ